MLKISVVVVNYNLADYLEDTLLSIIHQGYPNLELVVVDGGSTDGSVEIIRKYEAYIDWWVSEADEGHGDALNKGFAQTSGEVMAWLNSDDMYHHKALFAVSEIFSSFSEVEWLMGFPTEYSDYGATSNRVTLPWARWSKERYYTYDFQFIQQESSFWRRSLWEKAGSHISTDFRLAVDTELWARFFRHARLYTTLSLLGGFRYREAGQRSRDQKEAYLNECEQIIRRELANLSKAKRMWLPIQRILMFPVGLCFFYDIPILRVLYEKLYRLPTVLRYDFDERAYVYSKKLVRHPPLYLFGKQWALNPPKD